MRGTMQNGAIVPDDKVARLLPMTGKFIFVLLNMLEQFFDQLFALFKIHTVNVMRVGRHVHCRSTTRLMDLCDLVLNERRCHYIKMLEKW